MNRINTVLKVDADGTLHLPVPRQLGLGRVRVIATLDLVNENSEQSSQAHIKTPLDALREIRKLGGMARRIPDPMAWQREQRVERNLPGRE